MAEDLHLIRRFVVALVRRERLLLFGRMALQGALLFAFVMGFAVVAAAMRWDRSTAVMGVIVLGGVGAWAVVAVMSVSSDEVSTLF